MNPGREVSSTPLGVEDEAEGCRGVLVAGRGRPLWIIGCVCVSVCMFN